MAIKVNAKGTLYPSFSIGKDGATIYQGTTAPTNGSGNSGDLYIYINGSNSEFYQNQNGTWLAGASGVSQIVTGTGLTGGTITSSGTIALGISGVTAGTYGDSSHYPTFTVDALGRVTLAGTQSIPATGVTSVNGSGTNGVTVTGGPITGSGSLTIGLGAITPTSVTATGTVSGSNLSGTNTGDQTITLSGDISGSGTGAITTTLGTSGVTAGTYQGIVVNAKGLVTSATNQGYGTGSLTQIIAGSGLTGGTITNTGTLALGTVGTAGSYNNVTTDAYGRVTAGSNVSYLTTNQNITITGDATGNGSTSIALTLGTSGVTAGTYNQVVVNAKGLVTSGTSVTVGTGSVTSIVAGTDLTGGTITNTGTLNLATQSGLTSGTYQGLVVNSKGIVTSATNQNYLTSNQSITISGDASGAGSTAITLTLGTSGVTAGSGYNTFTVNAKGLVTSAGSTNYLTTNQTITVSGDASGSGSTAIALTLGTSGVTAGTYGNGSNVPTIVVDAKGRITNISTNNITFGTGSVTNIATGTGLTGGPITNTGTIAMGTSGVAAGTYGAGTSFPSIVVDSLGRVTSASTVALGSIASQNASNVNITGGTITGLPTPVNASDAANKAYVDNATTGLSAKASSRVATTGTNLAATYNNGTSGVGATLTLTGTGNIIVDGVTLNVNDRVLVKDQTSSYQNGIYSVTVAGTTGTSAVLTRTTDFNGTANIAEGAYTVIEEGSVNKGTLWLETGQGPFTIGTTSVIAFTELTVAPQTIAITGDATGTGAGTINITLDTVNSNVGTFGNTTNIPQITVNGKGLVTAISNTSITYGTGSVTQIIAGTGLTGGTINGTGTIAIGTTGVTAGTYQGLVVNALGQITSASNQNYLTSNQNITVTGDVSGSGSNAITLTLGSVVTAGTYNNVIVGTKGLVIGGSNASYLTSNQSITITGDATGAGSTAIALTLGSVNSNIGTFTAVTVGSKGLVTSATNLVASGDVTGTASGSGITLTLGTSGVTAGTYQGIVVNAKGLVTSATNQSYGTGSVTSINGTGSNGISVTGGPITTTGTLNVGLLIGAGLLLDPNGSLKTNWINSGTNISTTTYTISGTQSGGYFVNSIGSNIAITLPSAGSMANGALAFFAPTTGTMTLTTSGTQPGGAQQTIYGYGKAATTGTSFAIPPQNNVVIQSDGANWHVIIADIGATLAVGSNLSLANGTLSYTGSTGTGSVTQIIAGSGLTGGTIVGTGTIALGTSGVTAGTYNFAAINVDQYGRVTETNISTLSASSLVGNAATSSGTIQSISIGTGLQLGTTGILQIGTSGVTAGTYNQVVVNSLGQVTSGTTITAGTGSVTQIIAGTGLTGGTINETGTIAIGTSGVTAGTYGSGSSIPQITVNALGQVTAASSISVNTSGNTKTVTQTAHGFVVGNILELSGTTYALAKADSASDAEVVGVVTTVIDTNDFILTSGGYVTGLSGLTAGSVYFLSPTTAGALTATAPTTLGQVSKPLLIADSGTSGYFNNWRGEILGTTSNINGSTLVGNASAVAGVAGMVTLGTGLQFTGGTSLTIGSTVVTGPGTSTNNAIATWNGTAGNIQNNSVVTLDGTGNISGVNSLIMNGNLITAGNGFVNKFRNPCFDVAQRGTNGTITTAFAYTLDGWMVKSTGANCGWAQSPNSLYGFNLNGLILQGISGVTDIQIKQRIESNFAAQITGTSTTVQFIVVNNTGSAITPTLTINYATGADNGTYTNNVVNGVALQSVANNAVGTLAYTFNGNATGYNYGMEVLLDLGNNFNGSGKFVQIFTADIRSTPGVPVGTNNNPPVPERRLIGAEMPFCQRYLQVFNGNGSDIGMGFVGQAFGTANALVAIPFQTPMRTTPSFGTLGSFAVTLATSGRQAATSLSINNGNAVSVTDALIAVTTSGGLAAGNATTLWSESATAYLLFTAEL